MKASPRKLRLYHQSSKVIFVVSHISDFFTKQRSVLNVLQERHMNVFVILRKNWETVRWPWVQHIFLMIQVEENSSQDSLRQYQNKWAKVILPRSASILPYDRKKLTNAFEVVIWGLPGQFISKPKKSHTSKNADDDTDPFLAFSFWTNASFFILRSQEAVAG